MKITLSPSKKKTLKFAHHHERDSRTCDRIKAVLLRSEDWTYKQISQALRIHEETVRKHAEDWQKEEKIKPVNDGSKNHLNCEQTHTLIAHLEQKTYTCVADICSCTD